MVLHRKLRILCHLSVLTSLGIAACARLNVEVDVLNPQYFMKIQEDIALGRIVALAEAGDQSSVISVVDNICRNYHAGRVRFYTIAIDLAEREIKTAEDEQARPIKTAISASKESREQIQNVIESGDVLKDCADGSKHSFGTLTELVNRFQNIACPDGECSDNTHDFEQRRLAAIAKYQGALIAFERRVGEGLTDQATAVFEAYKAPFAKADKDAKSLLMRKQLSLSTAQSIRGLALAAAEGRGFLGVDGRTLAQSDLAFAAADAKREHWEKKYNVARGLGFGGSTDMVVKLNSTADFSVKGLVFDARATALTARKLTISALQLLASGSGVPITAISSDNKPAGSSEGGGQTSGKVLDDNRRIVEARNTIHTEELSRTHFRAALRRIASAVLASAEAAELEDNAANLKAARETAKAVFDANERQLKAIAGD